MGNLCGSSNRFLELQIQQLSLRVHDLGCQVQLLSEYIVRMEGKIKKHNRDITQTSEKV